jgi:methylmalonic aciduria homocystinuria type C protein
VHDGARSLVDEIAARCRTVGIDLVQPLSGGWYDAAVAPEHRLPGVGRRSPLVLLLASTRAFWRPFVARLAAEPGRLEHEHPLDRWVEDAVRGALRGVGVRYEVRFSHEPPPRRVAMQRLAHVSGLAPLAPSMLSVHPVYGPWIGLRAAVVLDTDGPPGPAPAPALACDACARRCTPALERAQRAAATGAGGDPVRGNWHDWLAVRDACPVGREHRYPDGLIRYVYTKDRAVLRAAAARLRDAGEAS